MALNINGTTGISGVDGSVSAPALTGTDSNTGITFPAADTIKFATGGVERMSITNSGISGITAGITMADQWRVSSDISIGSSGQANITSNWERNDSVGFTGIGSAMTESSGIFTFPTTGIYFITFIAVYNSASLSYNGIKIVCTQNNSSYSDIASGYDSTDGGTKYSTTIVNAMFDVVDVSTHKVAFKYEVAGAATISGQSDAQRSGVTFLRLGDT